MASSSKEKTDQELLDWVSKILAQCQIPGWFGTVTIRFQNGKIVLAEPSRTYKPEVANGILETQVSSF